MRTNRIWKTMLLLAVSGFSAQAGLSRLEAISMLETGNNDRAIGRAGEVSRYQIKPLVWKRYSRSTAYTESQLSSWVAERHLEFLENAFRTKTGREPTDFDRYVLWNGGFGYYARIGFSAKAVKAVIRERARRYVNLRQIPDSLPVSSSPAALAMTPAKRKG